ncbi:seven-hairpin glycosidase, partial [Eremomyces bilateralis CBS 781.70]
TTFKFLSAALVLIFYFVFMSFKTPTPHHRMHLPKVKTPPIQFGHAVKYSISPDPEKLRRTRDAMQHTWYAYRNHAWGHDGIKPVSGKPDDSRNGWGAFIVDSSTTLALMDLWSELKLNIQHILRIDFTQAIGLVDPFETTIRYLGGMLSLIEMSDAGLIPEKVIDQDERDQLLAQAVTLAEKLGPAFDTPTGLPWPRVDFKRNIGTWVPDPGSDHDKDHEKDPNKPPSDPPSIGPARAGTNILEYHTLSKLTGDATYINNATRAWTSLVWPKKEERMRGLVEGPINILTGKVTKPHANWDGGHDSFYEYLLKASLLIPSNRHTAHYQKRFHQAATSLREHLTSRSAYEITPDIHLTQHLFLGKRLGPHLLNEQSHLACFAPATLLLATAHLRRPDLRPLARALLESCHHLATSTPSNLPPELARWMPATPPYENASFAPESSAEWAQLSKHAFWAPDPAYHLRPEYFESLFVAYRVTGEARYRDWAWEAFEAIDRRCRARYGYAGLVDVMAAGTETKTGEGKGDGEKNSGRIDLQESWWAAETVKYAFLIFGSGGMGGLDEWVFSTEGHLFR